MHLAVGITSFRLSRKIHRKSMVEKGIITSGKISIKTILSIIIVSRVTIKGNQQANQVMSEAMQRILS